MELRDQDEQEDVATVAMAVCARAIFSCLFLGSSGGMSFRFEVRISNVQIPGGWVFAVDFTRRRSTLGRCEAILPDSWVGSDNWRVSFSYVPRVLSR